MNWLSIGGQSRCKKMFGECRGKKGKGSSYLRENATPKLHYFLSVMSYHVEKLCVP